MEISFLNKEQVETWQHPSLYDFHYSEGWRVRYEEELSAHESHFLKEGKKTDPDLAAHVTITNHRGICIEGPSIIDLFPAVTRSHYVSSIMSDYEDCLRNIEADPVYCVLNLIRVKWYLKEGKIASKKEAGEYGIKNYPYEYKETINKVLELYRNAEGNVNFEKEELQSFRDYIKENN